MTSITSKYLLIYYDDYIQKDEGEPVIKNFESMDEIENYVEQITTYDGYSIYEIKVMA